MGAAKVTGGSVSTNTSGATIGSRAVTSTSSTAPWPRTAVTVRPDARPSPGTRDWARAMSLADGPGVAGPSGMDRDSATISGTQMVEQTSSSAFSARSSGLPGSAGVAAMGNSTSAS